MIMERRARFLDSQGHYHLGRVLGLAPNGEPGQNASIEPLVGDLFGEVEASGPAIPLHQVRLLPPVVPSKIIGIGSNYKDHAAEMGRPLPTVPKIFLKPSSAIIGPEDTIELPPGTDRVDHEAELGIVIGRTLSRADRTECAASILGWTCVNDVTARDLQKIDGVFARAKGFDTFCPVGPWISLGMPPASLSVRCAKNGVLTQNGNTADMVFDVLDLLVFVSSVMTLVPGDLIATGTPAGVGPLQAGDRVEVFVEGAGWLRNPVRNRSDRT
jgi:2-keto-4-pentenoate hydratase/2-oxohepta-3-ene-1,7-dioic acid hydratase in catechol pathway